MKVNRKKAITCSGGLLNAGETEMPATSPEPDRISLRMPLMPRSSKVFAPRWEPLAHVERSLIKPCKPHQVITQPQMKKCSYLKSYTKFTVYVDGLRDAWPPPELLVEMREAACVTSPWLQSSSSLSGEEAKASAILVKQIEACSKTYIERWVEMKNKMQKW